MRVIHVPEAIDDDMEAPAGIRLRRAFAFTIRLCTNEPLVVVDALCSAPGCNQRLICPRLYDNVY